MLIGTDGDGVNDANERNIIGGVVPTSISPDNGYPHNIEFYHVTGTNIVIAGNYIGVGIDGVTRFTNGVAAFNGDTDVLSYDQGLIRMGSDFDGISDALEANVIFNNYPPELFPASDFPGPDGVNFFDELNKNATTTISLRGNVLVDGHYEMGRENGRWITYHINGRKAAEGRMVRGEKVGPWRTWDEDGRMLSEVVYRPRK